MRLHRKSLFLLLTIPVLFAGCEAKLKDKITQSLPALGEKDFVIPASKSARKVVVDVTATEPVRAVILKAVDAKPDESFAIQKEPSKQFTLECDQPANEELTLNILVGEKATEVTILLSSK